MGSIKRSNARGKRGKALEGLVEYSNRMYLQKGKARIDKTEAPMKTYRGRTFYEAKGLSDFVGTIMGGRSIAFDAKQTNQTTRFDLMDETQVKPHQWKHLEDVHDMGGVAFFLIEFTAKQEIYILPIEVARAYKSNAENGGRKSVPYKDFHDNRRILRVEPGPGVPLDYLKAFI